MVSIRGEHFKFILFVWFLLGLFGNPQQCSVGLANARKKTEFLRWRMTSTKLIELFLYISRFSSPFPIAPPPPPPIPPTFACLLHQTRVAYRR